MDKKLTDLVTKMLHTPSHYLRAQISEKKDTMKFEITRYPPGFFDEERMALFLFDLEHFPLERVIQRFESEGGRIILS